MNNQISISNGALVHFVESEAIIVSLEKGVILSFNATGAELLRLLQDKRQADIDELTETLSGLYDQEKTRLQTDIHSFISDLAGYGVIQYKNSL